MTPDEVRAIVREELAEMTAAINTLAAHVQYQHQLIVWVASGYKPSQKPRIPAA